MNKSWIGAAVLALTTVLAGCETAPVAPGAGEAKAALPSDPKAALAQAEADVKEAEARNALWTTASAALKAAQAAAAKGDWDAALKNARIASDQARLGIEQTRYPLAKHF